MPELQAQNSKTVYQGRIMNWLDGDTCQVQVDLSNADLGFHVTLYRTVRVFGMNAPEIHSKDAQEKARGLAAKAAAEAMAPIGSRVSAQSGKEHGQDKYGRWLARITLESGKDFATAMIASGFALYWDGSGDKPI